MLIWGYTDTDPALGGTAQLPGPTIIANQGEFIEVILHNHLGETTSMIFAGQAMLPDLTGVAPGGFATYSFTASGGTYLYEAGPLPGAQHQVAMGLHGALVVRPAANQAYGLDTTFHDEALLVLSDIDPALNNDANPSSFDMRDYAPKYFLINGKAYPQTDEIPSTAGNTVLLRFVNAGIEQHSMGTLGVDQEVIAIDGSPLSYPFRVASATIGSGQTTDRFVTMPDPAPAGGAMYALYDTSLMLHNNGAAGYGGMLTFIALTDGTPPATGPTTSAVTLTPGSTNGSVDVIMSATISGASNITGAEYFIDVQGADGTGVAMATSDSGFDSPTEAVEATITVADLALLDPGDHTLYIHGTDGTWGVFNFAVLHLDTEGPATSGTILAPNPSNGSAAVAVSATGNDSTTGNSNITGAEYFIDAQGADGTGTTMTVNIVEPIASLSGTIDSATMAGLAEGSHDVFVHSMDAFGWWGDYEIVTLVVDQTGPTTSNVVANPNPNNGSTPYSPTVFAVRVDAALADTSSNIQRAEGFINTVGADGSGFPLTPRDGLFNELVEDAYVYIPLSTISQLGAGTHQIYVHAQDTSGNWGATHFVDFVIETDLPTISNIMVAPSPTESAASVSLTADASDPTSYIARAEWFEGIDPGLGNGTSMAADDGTFDSMTEGLTANIDVSGWADGVYTLFLRARDAAGNWSDTISVDLTVSGSIPPAPTTLYFSTSGNGDIPGVGNPFDDADVYHWDAGLFSRVFDGSADGGLPGNTDIDALAVEAGLFYLSFNRNGGTNVPGLGSVQDEDIVTYNPGDFQWELFSAGVDLCDGMDASNGHDIDAFDIVNGVIYFSTEGDAGISGLAGPFDDADIYMVDAGCSRVFDASVEGLPGNANIDGLTAVDGDTFYMSFDQDDISVDGLIVQDVDVVLFDAGAWSLHFDGTAQGLGGSNNQNLDAIDVQ
jgi:FtsP/CotA-like multicopper oxidase with cupredoxin domain